LLELFELELLELFELELFELFELELFELFELELFELFELELFELLVVLLTDDTATVPADAGTGAGAVAGGGGGVAAGGCGVFVASTTLHQVVPLPDAIPTPISGYCGLSRLARWSGELSHAATTSPGDEKPMARFSPQAVEANPDRVSRESPVVPSVPTCVSTPARAMSSA
jgi:hypothetical protein